MKILRIKLKKIFLVILCLSLVLSSIPIRGSYYSYASEVCDPEDEDYEECLAEEEAERLEEERERLEEEAEKKEEFEEEIYEEYLEENEDIPGWQPVSKEEFLNQYYGITPTPKVAESESEEIDKIDNEIPEVVSENGQTGEGGKNETNTNSASEIDVENINSTTLEQELNVFSNTGNNTIVGEDVVLDEDSSATEKKLTQENSETSSYEEDSSFSSFFSNEENGEELSGENTAVGDIPREEEESKLEGDSEIKGGSLEEETFEESQEETSHQIDNDQEKDNFTTEASDEGFVSDEEGGKQMSISEDVDEVTVGNENQLELENEMEVHSLSGENKVSGNEDEAELTTGKGTSLATVENEANFNVTEVEGGGKAEALNEETDDNSTNFISDEVSESLVIENENQAAVENNLSVSSTAGKNELSENEGEATLTTDEVEIIANLLNILNLNITGQDFTHLIINIFGNLTGEFDLDDIAEDYLGMDEDELMTIAKNTATGENSENTALANSSEKLEVANKNEAAVVNNVEVEGVTGQNELAENEGKATILTGRIKILTSILNFINANFSGTDWYFAMINIFGSLTGDIILPDPDQFLLSQNQGVAAINSQTGEGSKNQALAQETEEIAVVNENAAEVKNVVNAAGDSGTNQSLLNEEETEMETGKVNIAAQVMNWLNYNIFGNRWVMVVVNVFGRWLGKVIAFPGKGDIEAPENGTLVAVAGGEEGLASPVQAENQQTGENSENFAKSKEETNWEVSNENKAYLENNVQVKGVSGQNLASGNEDQVKIVTGWIDIGVNLLNLVNFNVAGRQWMLLIVNVFGDFLGNIVFPHQDKNTRAVLGDDSFSTSDESLNSSPKETLFDEGGFANQEIPGKKEEDDKEELANEEGLGGGENLTDEKSLWGLNNDDNFNEEEREKEEIILIEEEPFDNQQRLIREEQGIFVLAGVKANGVDLDDKKGLDFFLTNNYNQAIVDDQLAYNLEEKVDFQEEGKVKIIIWEIVEKLIGFFKMLLTLILEKEI